MAKQFDFELADFLCISKFDSWEVLPLPEKKKDLIQIVYLTINKEPCYWKKYRKF